MNIKPLPLLLFTTVLMSSSALKIALHPVQATPHIQSVPAATSTPSETINSELTRSPSLIAQAPPDIIRQGDSGNQAGVISEIATTYSGFGNRNLRTITAVRTDDNRLKLISWQVNGDGSMTRTGDSGNQAGEALKIDISGDGIWRDGKLVTAIRTTNGALKLISWQRDEVGNITRLGDSGNQSGDISMVKIDEVHPDIYVTAIRTAQGRLKLITWRLNSDGSLTRLSDSGNLAGDVSEIALHGSDWREPQTITTAVRDSQGKLKLITWGVSENGKITRLRDSGDQVGEARMIQLVGATEDYMVTSLRTASGQLKLITWDRDLNRVSDSSNQAGGNNPNGLNALMPHPHNDTVVSAVRTNNGRLKLINWYVTSSGQLVRANDSGNAAGEASLIALEGHAGVETPIVTAIRTQENRLKLITWDD
ncbi:MAG: hypothetical protein AAGD25_23435 [Cyanobacteria bacterium P01_F01_bin.150]